MNFLMKRNVHMQNQFSRRNGNSRSGISRKKFCPSKTCYLIQTDFSWQKARAGGIVFFCSKKNSNHFLMIVMRTLKAMRKKFHEIEAELLCLDYFFGVYYIIYMPQQQIFGLNDRFWLFSWCMPPLHYV